MQRAVQVLDRDKQRALMQWLTSNGPFWDDDRQHSGDDWLEYNGEIVTETAVGETAYCTLSGLPRGLVSIEPSCWLHRTLSVRYRENGDTRFVKIPNYWSVDTVSSILAAAPAKIGSWDDLDGVARKRCSNLEFTPDSFRPLDGHPFNGNVAERLLQRLEVLHKLKSCFNDRGERTPEGHRIYQQYFTGSKAWFSDSSDTEKSQFESALTFPNPLNAAEPLFCTWHGKVKTPQLRIHFTWPMRASEPTYIVYVGPKITKR